jgi:hypothetical protein
MTTVDTTAVVGVDDTKFAGGSCRLSTIAVVRSGSVWMRKYGFVGLGGLLVGGPCLRKTKPATANTVIAHAPLCA